MPSTPVIWVLMRAFDAPWAAMFGAIGSVVVAVFGFAAGFTATPTLRKQEEHRHYLDDVCL